MLNEVNQLRKRQLADTMSDYLRYPLPFCLIFQDSDFIVLPETGVLRSTNTVVQLRIQIWFITVRMLALQSNNIPFYD